MSLPRRAFLAVLICTPLLASAGGARVDVSGAYASTWDRVDLTQRGDRIHGTYVCCGGGTIEGRVIEGRVIRYRWKQPGGEGLGVWTIEPSGRLAGTWGWNQSDHDGGRWDLVPAGAEIAQ
jgi:hypothetical protein